MNKKIKENGRTITKHEGNLLANVTEEAMRKVRVLLVNKPSLPISVIDTALVTLKRRLENPNELAVPRDGGYPIFDRSDIDVNNEEYLDEKIELTLPDNPAQEAKYKRNHVMGRGDGGERIVKYMKEEEVYRFKEDEKEQFSVRKREISPRRSKRSRSREHDSDYKRRRYNEERYKRSPTRSPAKNYKSSCDDRQCSCNKTSESKRRDRFSQCKENRQWVKTDSQRSRRSTSRQTSTRSRRDYIRERSSRSPYNKKTRYSPQNRRISSSTKHFESRSQRKRNLSPPKKIHSKYDHQERLHKFSSKYTNHHGKPSNLKYRGVQGLWIPAPHFTPRNIPPVPMLGIPPHFVPGPPMTVPHPTCQFSPHFLPHGHRPPMPNKVRPTTNTSHILTTTPKNLIEEPSSTSYDKE